MKIGAGVEGRFVDLYLFRPLPGLTHLTDRYEPLFNNIRVKQLFVSFCQFSVFVFVSILSVYIKVE